MTDPPNIGTRAIIAALEAIGDDAVCVRMDVQITVPTHAWSYLQEPEVEVSVSFVVPARVAAQHGFAERRGLPEPCQE